MEAADEGTVVDDVAHIIVARGEICAIPVQWKGITLNGDIVAVLIVIVDGVTRVVA